MRRSHDEEEELPNVGKDLRFPHYKHLRQLYRQIYDQMSKESLRCQVKKAQHHLKSKRHSPDLRDPASEKVIEPERFRSVRMSIKKGI